MISELGFKRRHIMEDGLYVTSETEDNVPFLRVACVSRFRWLAWAKWYVFLASYRIASTAIRQEVLTQQSVMWRWRRKPYAVKDGRWRVFARVVRY